MHGLNTSLLRISSVRCCNDSVAGWPTRATDGISDESSRADTWRSCNMDVVEMSCPGREVRDARCRTPRTSYRPCEISIPWFRRSIE
jgi:hypothetical protein